MTSPASDNVEKARRRIADCFHGRDEQGRLIQRRDALNLAGLGLTAEEIEERFDGDEYAELERPLGEIGFEDLIHLRYLDLTSNKLERLPRGTRGFGQLRWLGLNFNKLASIASEAGVWKELQRLYLRKNQLKTLPEAVATWTQLEEVDLAKNEGLKSLPPAWLEALTQRRSDGSDAPEIVIELAESGLDIRYQMDVKKPLNRNVFRNEDVQAWLRGQPHKPDQGSRPDVPMSAPAVAIPSPERIREKIQEWGAEALADALASLGLRDSRWMSWLEDPSAPYRRTWSLADWMDVESEVIRLSDPRASQRASHPLWRAWYVSGLRRSPEADEARLARAGVEEEDSDPNLREEIEVTSSAPQPPRGRKGDRGRGQKAR